MQIRALSGFSENTIQQYGRPYSPLGNITVLGGLSKRQNNNMNTSETLLGNVHNAQGIGKIDFKVNTESQVKVGTHNARVINPFLVAARTGFLTLLRMNVWGLATLLSKKAFEVSEAVTQGQTMGKYWWDLQAKWRNAWWNLGGTWDKFVSAVNTGKNKKFFALALAPKNIKAKLKAQGISGLEGIGIDPATTAAITAATALIAAISGLVLGLFENVKKDAPEQVEEIIFEDDTLKPKTGILKGGAGLIGVAILAALYFGTMKKK